MQNQIKREITFDTQLKNALKPKKQINCSKESQQSGKHLRVSRNWFDLFLAKIEAQDFYQSKKAVKLGRRKTFDNGVKML